MSQKRRKRTFVAQKNLSLYVCSLLFFGDCLGYRMVTSAIKCTLYNTYCTKQIICNFYGAFILQTVHVRMAEDTRARGGKKYWLSFLLFPSGEPSVAHTSFPPPQSAAFPHGKTRPPPFLHLLSSLSSGGGGGGDGGGEDTHFPRPPTDPPLCALTWFSSAGGGGGGGGRRDPERFFGCVGGKGGERGGGSEKGEEEEK